MGNISIEVLVITTFLSLIVVVFLKLIFWGDNKDNILQKIIGGLSVFMVAIISKDKTAFVLSLFIGGLIIASEEFMRSLAAILKAKGENLPEVMKELNTRLVEATPPEIEEGRGSEEEVAEEVVELVSKQDVDAKLVEDRDSFRERQEKRGWAEDLVLELFKEKFGDRYTPHVKFENEYGQMVADGVVHLSSNKDKLNIDNTLALVDIKYVGKENTFIFKRLIRSALEKVRFLFIDKQVLVVFVSDNMTNAFPEGDRYKLMEGYEKSKVVVAFFELVKEGGVEYRLEEVYCPPLSSWVK